MNKNNHHSQYICDFFSFFKSSNICCVPICFAGNFNIMQRNSFFIPIKPTTLALNRFLLNYFFFHSLIRCKAFVWMAVLMRVMRFWLQSSIHTDTSIPCRCLQTTKNWRNFTNCFSPAYFITFRAVYSGLSTLHPILELPWPRSCLSNI
jgi:hypothetical protein